MCSSYYQRLVFVGFLSLCLCLSSFKACAASVPVYNGKANQAVGGLIAQKLGRWGFAANDPRINATVGAVGTGATTLALAVAGGGVAAVGWPALLIGAGVSALVAGAVSLASDGLSKWLFGSDGNLTYTYPGGSTGNGAPGAVDAAPAGQVWRVLGWSRYSKSLTAAAYDAAHQASYPRNCVQVPCKVLAWDTAGSTKYAKIGYDDSNSSWIGFGTAYEPPGFNSCAGIFSDGSCGPSQVPTGSTTATKPVADAVADLPQSELAKPASDEMLAAAANALWKRMAASNTNNAVPWSATDPITPNDAAQWRAANPAQAPTVGDMIAPSVNPATNTVPLSAPNPLYNTGPSPTAGSGQEINLGEDPNTPAPTLEPTPTGQQILGPILNLMPDLKAFVVPAHSANCPTGSFVALGSTFTFQSHCALIESNRSLIEVAMLLCWALASVFIVLRA